jgi:hypothetical protein
MGAETAAAARILAASRLARAGGAVVTRLTDAAGDEALRAEALACAAHAEPAYVASPVDEDRLRGHPERWLESAPGGPVLDALYRSAGLLDLLADLTDLPWRPSGSGGTYSYYRVGGHHLGLHRDVEECDLAVIVCIEDRGASPCGPSGRLRLYPDRIREPLSAIRATREAGAVDVRLREGESLVLLGGWVPHELLPVARGQRRIVAPLCFTPQRPQASAAGLRARLGATRGASSGIFG